VRLQVGHLDWAAEPSLPAYPEGRTMAQRKSPSAPKANRPGGAARSPAVRPPGGRPPAKKGKSIVNQKQTPWGLIATTVGVVLFAVAVVVIVIATHKSGDSSDAGADPAYVRPEIATAKKISGVQYKKEPNHTHKEGVQKYDTTPPTGGNHSQYWADCTGTVYSAPIANENAVHMLEHGAIWITYNAKDVKGAQLNTLKGYVSGVDRMALSPYPDLKAPISLQAWNYQLFVNSASDPRITQFIAALKYNPKTTPEYGATCSQPTFKQHPSTFGHPLWQPAAGGSGNTMGS
jgi:hypothetical protein